jgi:hypothetical protein
LRVMKTAGAGPAIGPAKTAFGPNRSRMRLSSSPSRSSASSHAMTAPRIRHGRDDRRSPPPAPASRDAPLASRSLHGGQARRENSRSGGRDRGLYRRRAPRGAHSSCARKIRPNAEVCGRNRGSRVRSVSDMVASLLDVRSVLDCFAQRPQQGFRKEAIRCRHIVDTADQGRYRHSRQRCTFSPSSRIRTRKPRFRDFFGC